MIDREKVLKGLECLSDENNICSKNTCPYYMFGSCVPEISHDALELLKEQQETIELQGSLLTLAHAAMNQKRKKDKD